jgi:hypothetical protein
MTYDISESGAPAAHAEPPFVLHVDGEVADDGKAIALRIVRSGQEPVDVHLRTEDVQYMVSILLALSCEAHRRRPSDKIDGPPNGAIPLTMNAINVGLDDHDQAFLLLETGGTALMFFVPPNGLKEIGQTLLALSANPSGLPS